MGMVRLLERLRELGLGASSTGYRPAAPWRPAGSQPCDQPLPADFLASSRSMAGSPMTDSVSTGVTASSVMGTVTFG